MSTTPAYDLIVRDLMVEPEYETVDIGVRSGEIVDLGPGLSGKARPFPRWSAYADRALSRALTNEATERWTSSTVVAQEHTLTLMTGLSLQVAPPHQHSPDF